MLPSGHLFTMPLSPRLRRVALGAGVALVAGLVVALVILDLAQPNPLAWPYRLGVGQPYPWANTMSLQSVSMVSADEGWAVGHISGAPTTLLMHYAHGQWTILPQPAGLSELSQFTAVSMVSPRDGWAWASKDIPKGDRFHTYLPGGVLLRYDGAAWKIATPVFPISLESGPSTSALFMRTATDGWATAENKTLHYDGTAWREVTALTERQMGGGSAISATSPNDVWIAQFGGAIVHYDGKTWTKQEITLPIGTMLPGPILLRGIAMASPTEGFAVGGIGNSTSGVILRYLGGRWTVESLVDQGLNGISLPSAPEGWAVGGSGGIYHYQAGTWTKAAQPTSLSLYSVAVPPAGGDPWAVGFAGALLRYRDGAWQQETNVVWSQAAQNEWK